MAEVSLRDLAVLLERWRGLPRLNLDALRNDIDAVRERSDQS
jgi:hypothetical protein